MAFVYIFRVAAAAPVAAAGAGVAGVAAFSGATPAITALVNSANIPPGNPAPGAVGGLGAGLPAGAPAAVLALVPAGLVAVSVFPPYATPRTVPADSVIFLENPDVALLHRKKRSILLHIQKVFDKVFGQKWKRRNGYEHQYYNAAPSYGEYSNNNWWDDIKAGKLYIRECLA